MLVMTRGRRQTEKVQIFVWYVGVGWNGWKRLYTQQGMQRQILTSPAWCCMALTSLLMHNWVCRKNMPAGQTLQKGLNYKVVCQEPDAHSRQKLQSEFANAIETVKAVKGQVKTCHRNGTGHCTSSSQYRSTGDMHVDVNFFAMHGRERLRPGVTLVPASNTLQNTAVINAMRVCCR
jgi:hypothetical protein